MSSKLQSTLLTILFFLFLGLIISMGIKKHISEEKIKEIDSFKYIAPSVPLFVYKTDTIRLIWHKKDSITLTGHKFTAREIINIRIIDE